MALEIAQNYEYLGNDLWKWWVWLDGDDAELDTVEAVEYHLHPTFPNPVMVVKNRHTRFRLDSGGWAPFLLNARVCLTDGVPSYTSRTCSSSFIPREPMTRRKRLRCAGRPPRWKPVAGRIERPGPTGADRCSCPPAPRTWPSRPS